MGLYSGAVTGVELAEGDLVTVFKDGAFDGAAVDPDSVEGLEIDDLVILGFRKSFEISMKA